MTNKGEKDQNSLKCREQKQATQKEEKLDWVHKIGAIGGRQERPTGSGHGLVEPFSEDRIQILRRPVGSRRCQKTIKLPHKAVRGVKAESQEHGWTLVSRIQHGGLQTWFPAAGQLVLHLLTITEL